MPLTAGLQMSAGSVAAGQPATATLTLANAGAAALVVQAISCFATPHNSTQQTVPVNVGQPNLGPGFVRTVPPGGSIQVSFPVVGADAARDGGQLAMAPVMPYDIHALASVNDGTTVEAIAPLTVGPVYPSPGPNGFLDFSQAANSALLI